MYDIDSDASNPDYWTVFDDPTDLVPPYGDDSYGWFSDTEHKNQITTIDSGIMDIATEINPGQYEVHLYSGRFDGTGGEDVCPGYFKT